MTGDDNPDFRHIEELTERLVALADERDRLTVALGAIVDSYYAALARPGLAWLIPSELAAYIGAARRLLHEGGVQPVTGKPPTRGIHSGDRQEERSE